MYKRNIHWYIKKIRSMSAPYFFYCYYSAGISAGAEVSSTGAVSAAGVTAGAEYCIRCL